MKELKIPINKKYEPGEQVKKAKGKSVADTPEKIIKNII